MSVLVFLLLAIGFAVLFQRIMKGLVAPSLISALVTTLVFHIIGYILEGKVDSLVAVSFVTVSIIAFLIALGIGAAMLRAGKKNRVSK
jgi:hypothetical protein